MRTRLMVFLLALGLGLVPGCVKSNTPPTAALSASPESGPSPLTVNLTKHGFDSDGDALTMVLRLQAPYLDHEERLGEVSAGPTDGVTNATQVSQLELFATGEYRITMDVSDGKSVASASVLVRVVGTPYIPTLFKADGNVTASCPACSERTVGPFPQGAFACSAFLVQQQGSDCIWYPLDAAWEGKTFFANATAGADVDLELRADCDAGAGESQGIFAHDGLERDRIPPGARCAILWAWNKAPATIRFEVYA